MTDTVLYTSRHAVPDAGNPNRQRRGEERKEGGWGDMCAAQVPGDYSTSYGQPASCRPFPCSCFVARFRTSAAAAHPAVEGSRRALGRECAGRSGRSQSRHVRKRRPFKSGKQKFLGRTMRCLSIVGGWGGGDDETEADLITGGRRWTPTGLLGVRFFGSAHKEIV